MLVLSEVVCVASMTSLLCVFVMTGDLEGGSEVSALLTAQGQEYIHPHVYQRNGLQGACYV